MPLRVKAFVNTTAQTVRTYFRYGGRSPYLNFTLPASASATTAAAAREPTTGREPRFRSWCTLRAWH